MTRSDFNLAVQRQAQKIVREEYGDRIRELAEERIKESLDEIIAYHVEKAAKEALRNPYGRVSKMVEARVAEIIDERYNVRLVRKSKAKK